MVQQPSRFELHALVQASRAVHLYICGGGAILRTAFCAPTLLLGQRGRLTCRFDDSPVVAVIVILRREGLAS